MDSVVVGAGVFAPVRVGGVPPAGDAALGPPEPPVRLAWPSSPCSDLCAILSPSCACSRVRRRMCLTHNVQHSGSAGTRPRSELRTRGRQPSGGLRQQTDIHRERPRCVSRPRAPTRSRTAVSPLTRAVLSTTRYAETADRTHPNVHLSSVEKMLDHVWKSSLHLDNNCRDAAKIGELRAGYFDETRPGEGARQSARIAASGRLSAGSVSGQTSYYDRRDGLRAWIRGRIRRSGRPLWPTSAGGW